jgi:hypothetical protein
VADGIDVAIRSKENSLPIDKRDVVPDAGQSCAEVPVSNGPRFSGENYHCRAFSGRRREGFALYFLGV